MNTDQLRQVIRNKWLSYYEENRQWLTRLGVWVNCDGQRRPSSSFILATLSVLEPQLNQLLPIIVDLSSNPDRIVMALGLNFNPDDLLAEAEAARKAIAEDRDSSRDGKNGQIRMLPSAPSREITISSSQEVVRVRAREDESCRGARNGHE